MGLLDKVTRVNELAKILKERIGRGDCSLDMESAVDELLSLTDIAGVRESGECPYCGAKMVEYRFTFNEGLAIFLWKLHQAGGPAKTDDLELTYSQRTNSQKIRYWGLAEPHINEESKIKRGWWAITKRGRDFVEGRISISKMVVMYRNQFVQYEGDNIFFSDAIDGYEYHEDYADQVRQQV